MLNAGGALTFLLLTVAATSVEIGGTIPLIVVAPALALGFTARFFGSSLAAARGAWGMPWGARVTSWLLIGIGAYFAWSGGSLLAVAAYAAFVVLDFASGFVKREGEATQRERPSLRPMWTTVGIAAYLTFTFAFWFLVGRFVTHGVLITWTILAFGFALLLRLTLPGAKAGEAWLRAPVDHRRHERREQVVIDPQRTRAEQALASFRNGGDATAFLSLVRDAAASADLPDAERAALEKRILASFARAGTRRDQDLIAALDEVERALALRGASSSRAIPITPQETST